MKYNDFYFAFNMHNIWSSPQHRRPIFGHAFVPFALGEHASQTQNVILVIFQFHHFLINVCRKLH